MKQSYFRVLDFIMLFDISLPTGPHIYKPSCTMVDGGRLSYCRSPSTKGWSPTTYRHDTVHFIQPLYFDTLAIDLDGNKNELSKYTRIDLAVRIQLVLYPTVGREPHSNTEHKTLH
jgi:hypothetical protein